jgi:hypothetical protein
MKKKQKTKIKELNNSNKISKEHDFRISKRII